MSSPARAYQRAQQTAHGIACTCQRPMQKTTTRELAYFSRYVRAQSFRPVCTPAWVDRASKICQRNPPEAKTRKLTVDTGATAPHVRIFGMFALCSFLVVFVLCLSILTHACSQGSHKPHGNAVGGARHSHRGSTSHGACPACHSGACYRTGVHRRCKYVAHIRANVGNLHPCRCSTARL